MATRHRAESGPNRGAASERTKALAAVGGLLVVLSAAWAVGSDLQTDGGTSTPTPAPTEAGDAHEVQAARISGTDRIETSVAISEQAHPDGANRVYLARADVFADALAAGPLTGGPVLLVPGCGDLPPATAAEIERLDPERVTALGGDGAVCDALLSAAAAGRATERLAGAGRLETAVVISQAQFTSGAEEVYLASAFDAPDAVAGGVLTRGPVLLVAPDGPAAEVVRREVDRLDPDRVVALGGTSTVSGVALETSGGDRSTERLAGPARVETAARISGYQFGDNSTVGASADTVYLARADVFADAVAGGSLTDGPILLVPSCGDVPRTVRIEVTRLDPSRVVALGGTAAVCDELLDDVVAGARPVAAPPPSEEPDG